MGVAEEEGVWSEELSLRVEEGGERLKAVSDTALEHFKTLYDLSPPPSYSMDSFVKVHSRVRRLQIKWSNVPSLIIS